MVFLQNHKATFEICRGNWQMLRLLLLLKHIHVLQHLAQQKNDEAIELLSILKIYLSKDKKIQIHFCCLKRKIIFLLD